MRAVDFRTEETGFTRMVEEHFSNGQEPLLQRPVGVLTRRWPAGTPPTARPARDPNFGPPTNCMISQLLGQATQMLGASLGSGGQTGGLNPLYQSGGPRSVQVALKLAF